MLMSRQQIKYFSNHQWWRNKDSIRPSLMAVFWFMGDRSRYTIFCTKYLNLILRIVSNNFGGGWYLKLFLVLWMQNVHTPTSNYCINNLFVYNRLINSNKHRSKNISINLVNFINFVFMLIMYLTKIICFIN